MAFLDAPIFEAIKSFFDFGTSLAPALNEWIIARIPIEKQHEVKQRMQQCYRICKKEKLSGPLIGGQVRLFFQDFTQEQQQDVIAIMIFRLK